MVIKTSDPKTYKSFLKCIPIPKPNSHKGQNGKVLIIGGSSFFHASSIWAAEMASHLVDMVHYASTRQNEDILIALKKRFRNGIVVKQKDMPLYIEEDDAILIGPGMMRNRDKRLKMKDERISFNEILKLQDEGQFTYYLTKYVLEKYPNKKIVIDAGSLQMMEKYWLLGLKNAPILTPHQKEFETLFGQKVIDLPLEKKGEIVKQYAKKYKSIILLKAITDIVSDGKEIYYIEGGNAGLTKGGTGDILAALAVGFAARIDTLNGAILASLVLKKAADDLLPRDGYWYNTDTLIDTVPQVLRQLI